jgi:hypothetical protein
MRHLFEATEDVQHGIGDRVFNNKKGEKLELSAAGAEVLLGTPDLAKAYKLVRDIPETPEEKAQIEKQAEKTKLMGVKKETLVNRAERAGLETEGLKKEEVAEALVENSTKESK